MPQFDVYALGDGMLVVDCQAEALAHLRTRFCVPLIPSGRVTPISGLNPAFDINGEPMNLFPQGAATVPMTELKARASSLASERYRILTALDVLLSGV